jgi:hypothetical protein
MKAIARTFAVLVAVVCACGAAPVNAGAEGMGTLTENGVAMEVKAAVVVVDPGSAGTPVSGGDPEASIQFTLLPYQPSADEVARLQEGDLSWQMNKTTPDAKKWPTWVPYGQFTLNWDSRQDLGDVKKASSLNMYANGIGKEGNNSNGGVRAADVPITLTGALKDGQDVTLVTKGTTKLGNEAFSWDLNVKAKVLLKKQP